MLVSQLLTPVGLVPMVSASEPQMQATVVNKNCCFGKRISFVDCMAKMKSVSQVEQHSVFVSCFVFVFVFSFCCVPAFTLSLHNLKKGGGYYSPNSWIGVNGMVWESLIKLFLSMATNKNGLTTLVLHQWLNLQKAPRYQSTHKFQNVSFQTSFMFSISKTIINNSFKYKLCLKQWAYLILRKFYTRL